MRLNLFISTVVAASLKIANLSSYHWDHSTVALAWVPEYGIKGYGKATILTKEAIHAIWYSVKPQKEK